jgi:hypothetical protein
MLNLKKLNVEQLEALEAIGVSAIKHVRQDWQPFLTLQEDLATVRAELANRRK